MTTATQSRAERLIQAAETRSARRSTQDTEARLAYEVRLLRDEVRGLCAELEVFKPLQQTHLSYVNATMDRGLPVLVGYEKAGEELDLIEVWCGGLQIAGQLKPEVMESLRQQAFSAHEELRDMTRIEAQVQSRIDGRAIGYSDEASGWTLI